MSHRINDTATIASDAVGDPLEATLTRLFADVDAATAIADDQGRIIRVNAAMQRLFGYAERELLGRGADILQADDNDFVTRGRARLDARVCVGQGSYVSRCRRRDDSVFDAETIVAPIRDPGDGRMLYLGVLRDVSLRRPAANVLGVLHEITTDQELDFDQRRRAILDLGCNYFGLPTGTVTRIAGDRCEVIAVVDGDGRVQVGARWGLACTYSRCVLERDGPLGVDGTNRARLRAQIGAPVPWPRSYIGCPITIADECYGTLEFYSREDGGLFDLPDLELVSMLAERIGQDLIMERQLGALRDAHRRLSRIATIDDVTGLGNERLLIRQLDFELERGRRHRRTLSVALLDFDDVDAFESANGYAAGEAALRHVAERARRTLRGSDLIGRWQDHAFLLLLPETAQRAAVVSLARLLDDVRASGGDSESIAPAISAGVTTSACNESSDAILARAEQALSKARAAGGNRIAQIAAPARARNPRRRRS